ncbi:MAG: diguanylate cyclase [Acidimicrobiales bacterium]
MKRRLGVAILASIVLAQMATVGALLATAQRFRQQAIEEETRLQLVNASVELSSVVESYLRPVERAVGTVSDLLSGQVVAPQDLVRLMVAAMYQSPQLADLEIGTSSGNLYSARRRDNQVVFHVIRTVNGEKTSWAETFDASGRAIESKVLQVDGYDPRTSNWYIAGMNADGETTWGDPYVFFGSGTLGIDMTTRTITPSGKVEGVVHATVDLSALSAELANSPLGGAVVYNQSGLIIAHSDSTLTRRLGSHGFIAQAIENLDDRRSQGAVSVAAQVRAAWVASEASGIARIQGTETMVAAHQIQADATTWTIVLFGEPDEVIPAAVTSAQRETQLMRFIGGFAVLLTGLAAYPTTRRLRKLQRDADLDALTGLSNRRSVLEAAATLLANGRVGIATVDLDHFKQINDTYGHAVGDEVLVEIAKRLSGAVRAHDLVGRIGGEEFLIVFDLTEGPAVGRLAERIRETIAREPVETSIGCLNLTASIGTVSGAYQNDLKALLEEADQAMYVAKHEGRNRVVDYDEPRNVTDEPVGELTLRRS